MARWSIWTGDIGAAIGDYSTGDQAGPEVGYVTTRTWELLTSRRRTLRMRESSIEMALKLDPEMFQHHGLAGVTAHMLSSGGPCAVLL